MLIPTSRLSGYCYILLNMRDSLATSPASVATHFVRRFIHFLRRAFGSWLTIVVSRDHSRIECLMLIATIVQNCFVSNLWINFSFSVQESLAEFFVVQMVTSVTWTSEFYSFGPLSTLDPFLPSWISILSRKGKTAVINSLWSCRRSQKDWRGKEVTITKSFLFTNKWKRKLSS